MIGNARGSHSSPGIYTKEIDLTYASKSLGITTLGVVGETLKGPAFEPIRIENWKEFVDYFGGTSAEKFKGSQYPKYELPYIAKSYLKNSNQLEVCRVLGLSGYNAGPAWLITASKDQKLLNGHYESYGGYVSAATMASISLYGTEYSNYKSVSKVPSELLIEDDKVYPFLLSGVTEFYVWKYDDVVEGEYVQYNDDMNKFLPYYKQKFGDDAPQPANVTEIPTTLYRSANKEQTYPCLSIKNTSDNTFKYYVWNSAVNVLMTENSDERYVVAVLRSRGSYKGNGNVYIDCTSTDKSEANNYDAITYYTTGLTLDNYVSASYAVECSGASATTKPTAFDVKPNSYGRFIIKVNDSLTYPVSLNPGDKDYILNVLGSTPSDGSAPVFVEELYDVAYMQMVNSSKLEIINTEPLFVSGGTTTATTYGFTPKLPTYDSVYDIFDDKLELNMSHVGFTFLCDEAPNNETGFTAGTIYKVVAKKVNGQRIFEYEALKDDNGTEITLDKGETVFVMSKDRFYEMGDTKATECSTDINDYKEQFRCASTPWIVSELKGDGQSIELRKLFRFHTISDGDAANSEVKVSIQNIRPDEGLFDVVVRKFDDMDSTPQVLERFTKCSMVPGTNNFIGFKIGTFDGEYIVKSKYITVEVIASELTETCVPAGFLGYPMREYKSGQETVKIINPLMGYNTMIDEDIKDKKQYFGFSNITGIDVDLFKYKGRNAYDNISSLSSGFHLDSRIESLLSDVEGVIVTVDGETGFTFQTVSAMNTTGVQGGVMPRFSTEEEMRGSIYENVNLRKFTVCFYGGFDGWDPYRDERTNGDKFKANKYKGLISNGFGANFSQINDASQLNLVGNCITSDYYAYLAGARQFDNIEAVDINMFATPGIDYVNQTMLSKEILSMIEEERGDSIYIMTTPDAPAGSNQSLYYPDEVVSNLEDAEIDSSYAATYYPWVKYYDKENSVYINLPATKDVLSAMAYTDNISYPWFAPAGTVRGAVECERAAYITKLEDEDTLYSGRINPIKTFATDGVKIWGQKTMYEADTPLNRINVRRLMLRVKKLITGACRRLIFEQNDATVKKQFEGLVKPILDNIKSKRGIYDYKLEINDSAEARDRLELPAVIYIKPTKALEYIDLSFVIAPESISFDE